MATPKRIVLFVLIAISSKGGTLMYSGEDKYEIEFLTQFGYLEESDFVNTSIYSLPTRMPYTSRPTFSPISPVIGLLATTPSLRTDTCSDLSTVPVICATEYVPRVAATRLPERSPSKSSLLTLPDYKKQNAIRKYQEFYGLTPTGLLDNATKEYMKMPRCGNKDTFKRNVNNRVQRFAFLDAKWDKNILTYKILNYPSDLRQHQVDYEIEKAFKMWQDVTPLKFIRRYTGSVDIDISFERGYHGDQDNFTKNSISVAHGFEPYGGKYSGDVHFNIEKTWTVKSSDGINLFQTAAHEFGHSLGLNHSTIKMAVMYAYLRKYDPNYQLDDDDKQGIQILYPRIGGTDVRVPTSIRSSNDDRESRRSHLTNTFDVRVHSKSAHGDLMSRITDTRKHRLENYYENNKCSIKKIDAVLNYDYETYIFIGDNYWRFTETSVVPGYPKKIYRTWRELPANIDAAFAHPNGRLYFFKGDQYWKYKNNRLDDDYEYPRLISDEFPGVPNYLDAAMVWPSGATFFFKGSQIWILDGFRRRRYSPTAISSYWRGLPNDIDAAVSRSDGYMYFFKNNNYYRYYHKSYSMDRDFPPYPRPVDYWWFGCNRA